MEGRNPREENAGELVTGMLLLCWCTSSTIGKRKNILTIRKRAPWPDCNLQCTVTSLQSAPLKVMEPKDPIKGLLLLGGGREEVSVSEVFSLVSQNTPFSQFEGAAHSFIHSFCNDWLPPEFTIWNSRLTQQI